MGRKKSDSIKRVFQAMEGKSLAEINLIQTAYINKDYKQLAKLNNKKRKTSPTDKTGVSDAYLMSLGRLASQYVNHLSKPTASVKAIAKKKYNTDLIKTGNEITNLSQNIIKIKKKQIGGGGSGKRFNLFPFRPFSRSHNPIELEYVFNRNINLTKFDIIFSGFLNDLQQEISNYNANFGRKIRLARLTIKYQISDKTIHYFSTKKLNIRDFVLDALGGLQMLTYNDLRGWEQISPKNIDLIEDLYKMNKSILKIKLIKITYYH